MGTPKGKKRRTEEKMVRQLIFRIKPSVTSLTKNREEGPTREFALLCFGGSLALTSLTKKFSPLDVKGSHLMVSIPMALP